MYRQTASELLARMRPPYGEAFRKQVAARLTPYPEVEDELRELDCDEFYFSETRPFAAGTLGEGCRRFWRANGLTPFAVKPPAKSSSAHFAVVVRGSLRRGQVPSCLCVFV